MRRIPLLLSFGLLVAPTMPAQSPAVGRLRSEARTVTLPDGTQLAYDLGYLEVPENRNDVRTRKIEISYLRMPAAPGANGAPVFFLAGGPGDAAIPEDPRALAGWTSLRQVGDVILVDQRGTGRSRPNLAYRWQGAPPVHLFRSSADARQFIRVVAESAAAHFRSQGTDLRGYTTVESADDIEALRVALGIGKINILGFSYGTHLGLSVIRRHGKHVQGAVLVGVEGPDHSWKLPRTMDTQWARLSLLAAADSGISARIPDLDALLRRVLARLDAAPMMVTIRGARGDSLRIPVGGDGLRYFLRRDIGDASDLPVFPRLLYSIDQGDPTLLQWFTQRRFGAGSHVMSAVMDAASGVSALRRAQIEAESAASPFRTIANFPYPDDATGMDAPDLGDGYRSPVVSNVRTLFLSGTLDFNTPPFQAEEVRWGFSDSHHIIVGNAGHEQVLTHPAVRAAIVRFLKGEAVHDVTAAWSPLRFVPLTGHDPERTHPSVRR